MKILNLGCGTKVCDHPDVINVDWCIELRLRRNSLSRTLVQKLVRGERLEKFNRISDNIEIHDLAKGIPAESNSIDVVYHSHLLEHLDRDVAEIFLIEVKRVLKPGGIHRIVVPDLERLCKAYSDHLLACRSNQSQWPRHDKYVAAILEQCVRREAYGTSRQRGLFRRIENVFFGDARKRGETHQWMYDEFSLKALLLKLGYRNIIRQKYQQSLIANWISFGLDQNATNDEYKTGSLYVEALK